LLMRLVYDALSTSEVMYRVGWSVKGNGRSEAGGCKHEIGA